MNSEDLIEMICNDSFFADFVVRSPKYYKKCGLERETADVLVVSGDTLFAIQVKSMICRPDITEELLHQRIGKRINKAIRQFRALSEAVALSPITEVISLRGIPRELDFRKMEHFYLIVVFDLISTDGSRAPNNLVITESWLRDSPLPLHVFTQEQFSLIAEECDTIPDFSKYLDYREVLHRTKFVGPRAHPLDILALLRFRRKKAREVLDHLDNSRFEIDGLWGKCIARNFETICSRRKNPEFYIVDWVIKRLYTGIDYQPGIGEKLKQKLRLPLGSVEVYRATVEILASLDRSERGEIGRLFLSKVKCALMSGLSYGGVVLSSRSLGIVVVASTSEENIRCEVLCSVCIAFMGNMNVDTVLGIVCDAAGFPIEEFHAIILRREDVEITPDLLNKARELFAQPVSVCGD